MRPLRIHIAASLTDLPDVPTVMAYGDQDDHLRITALLASLLADRVDPRAVQTCTSPRTSWRDRRTALEELLREAQADRNGATVRLVDPDALDLGDMSPATRWDDASFRSERGELFDVLRASFRMGGWELVRPEPRASTTSKLDPGYEIVESAPALQASSTADEQRLDAIASAVLAPALRPLVDAMIAAGQLYARQAARMLEASSAGAADDLVLEIAYDMLSVDAIDAAKRLSLLRGPQVWNGVAGPFRLEDDGRAGATEQPPSVPREAAHELVRGGWIDVHGAAVGGHRFLMGNPIRRFLQARAEVTHVERVLEDHRWLAGREPVSVVEGVEAHHHAVASGDSDLAIRTARYYGADLRTLAVARSKEGRFDDAARLFGVIIEDFDDKDAYAWEYKGYNLALAHRDPPIPPPVEQGIRAAYDTACRLQPNNPLYRGREIGFRARMGERVLADLGRYLQRFSRDGDEAVSYLAKPVLDAMRQADRLEVARSHWARPLLRHPDLGTFFR